METPKKHRAQGTFTTLKDALNNENYLRALELIERAQKNSLKNGFYIIEEDE